MCHPNEGKRAEGRHTCLCCSVHAIQLAVQGCANFYCPCTAPALLAASSHCPAMLPHHLARCLAPHPSFPLAGHAVAACLPCPNNQSTNQLINVLGRVAPHSCGAARMQLDVQGGWLRSLQRASELLRRRTVDGALRPAVRRRHWWVQQLTAAGAAGTAGAAPTIPAGHGAAVAAAAASTDAPAAAAATWVP